jgi:DNA-directed RNA polymerase specialized sigma24 family protein
VADKVARVLLRRRAQPALIDDAVQVAALQVICRSERFDSFDGMVRWVTKVAWNEVQMEWRRRSRAQPGEVPERADGPDPAAVVEVRQNLDATVRGLAALSRAEREAILSALDDAPAERHPETASTKMRRHRARRHLAAWLAGEGIDRLRQP